MLKVPQNAQNVLIDTLPKVHKSSGSSSPKELSIVHSSSAEIEEKLEEKLLVASVSSAVISKQEDAMELETTVPLIDKTHFRGYPRMITGRHDYLSFNGSDCELNWIVLLIGILALCVVLPLVIFYLVYEHPEKFAHEHIRFDDPDIGHRQLHHLNDQHFASTSSDS